MLQLRFALCLTMGLLGIAHPQSADVGLYNEANALYRASRFAEALERYAEAANTGSVDWRLFYNLGNAHFKVGRIGEAILWYERALKLNPRDEDINANLRFLNRVKEDQEPAIQGNPMWRFFESVFSLPTLNELSVALCVALFLLVSLGVWHIWQEDSGGTRRVVSLVILGGVTLCCALWLGSRALHEENLNEAVIVVSQVTARSGPDETQTVVLVVHEGTKVRIDRREGNWALVRLSNGLGGWLQQGSFIEI